MKPISTNPKLPYPNRAYSIADLTNYDQELIKWLYTYFANLALRVNNTLPKDGSEPMTGALDMGGFDIINAGDFTTTGTVTATTVETTDLTATGTVTTVDLDVSGTLTAAIGIITDLTATDAIIDDLEVTNDLDVGGELLLAAPPIINGVTQWETLYDASVVGSSGVVVPWTIDKYKVIEILFHATMTTSTGLVLRHTVAGTQVSTNTYNQILTNWDATGLGASSASYVRTYLPVGRDENLLVHPYGSTGKITFQAYRTGYIKGRVEFDGLYDDSVVRHGFQVHWISLSDIDGFVMRPTSGATVMDLDMIVRGHI